MTSSIKPQITLISVHDPEDIGNWSGINYFLLKTLRKHFEVQVISKLSFTHSFLLKIHFYINKLLGYKFYYELSNSVTKQLGKQVSPLIDKKSAFVITVNSHLITRLQTKKPVILFDDATLQLLDGYYDFFSNQHPWYKKISLKNERKAFTKCYKICMSSQWAADSVINYYKQPSDKVVVWPFGANLTNIPSTDYILNKIDLKCPVPFRLLWVGVDRKRKGADHAIQLTALLRNAGLNVTLDLIGIMPNQGECIPDFIRFWGKLNKAIPEEQELFSQIFEAAHLFVLPTQIDCSPVVISEAAAFGLPVIATKLSGIPSIILHGKTGYLVNEIEEYVTLIKTCINDWNLYKSLSKESRYFYDTQLNWDVNTKRFVESLKDLLI